jgi:FkbH-like protein
MPAGGRIGRMATNTRRFTHGDVQRFAAWSGDRNPLHVDPATAARTAFGRPVVHGALTALAALTASEHTLPLPGRRLDAEFRGPVFPDAGCEITEPGPGTIVVRAGGTTAVTLRLSDREETPPTPDVSWVAEARGRLGAPTTPRTAPASPDVGALAPGTCRRGVYAVSAPPADYVAAGRLDPLHVRILGLCSYVVGMELPGLHSVFTRLSLTFEAVERDTPSLLYQARVVHYDPQFRLLDVRLDVATPEGEPAASGTLRSYVRFSPVAPNVAALAAGLTSGRPLAQHAALVCGGTRGLGAEITAALALAGCHVYASYRRDSEAARDLGAAIAAAGGQAEFLEGDAGDEAWCRAARDLVTARHGGLDLLVLNACAPPAPLRRDDRDSAGAFTRYVADNLPLAQVPLSTCLPAMAERAGTVLCISSSFVTDPPPGFGHYVALKSAVESAVRSAVAEAPGLRALIARPPRLQTAWNDTPAAVVGTIPAADAAVAIVNRLAASRGPVDLLDDFPRLPAGGLDRFESDVSSHVLGQGRPRVSALSRMQPGEAEPLAGPGRSLASSSRRPDEDVDVDVVIRLAASFTSEPVAEGLRFWLRELHLHGEIELAPYGQVLQTLLAPPAAPPRGRVVQLVLVRLRDWLRELPGEQGGSTAFLAGYLENTARDFERAMHTHRAHAQGPTVLVFCPSALEHPNAAEPLLEALERDLAGRLAGLPGLTVTVARDLHDRYDVADAAIADPVRDRLAHLPYRAPYFRVLATIAMRLLHRAIVPARKVVVVDCDNTLWGGVVGEVGAEGLTFDAGHRALHDTLNRLSEHGVLIGLCSKNEEADVWRVFDTRQDLGLPRDQVVAAAINWQPKSANLRALASRLNLGLDSFLFIDDNPVECAEVRAACPEVLTLEWPQDPDRARRLLDHTWELDPRAATAEDRRRTELYREEFRRQALQAEALTFRDFIASLDLTVDIAPLTAADLERAAQLTLRTNQFNFTTRRRQTTEVQDLASSGVHDVRTVRVRDRFGDYGLVGLLVAEHRGGELFADTFLLSCRVLGRGVEHRMLAELGRLAEECGARTVRLRVEPTARNTPARAFLAAVTPAGHREDEGDVIQAMLPAAWAAAVVFDPPEEQEIRRSGDTGEETGGQEVRRTGELQEGGSRRPGDVSGLRAREAQIARAAFELSSMDGLARAIDGPARATTSTAPARSAHADAGAVLEVDQPRGARLRLAQDRRDHRGAARVLSLAARHAALRAPSR